jgi:hypothetical protein
LGQRFADLDVLALDAHHTGERLRDGLEQRWYSSTAPGSYDAITCCERRTTWWQLGMSTMGVRRAARDDNSVRTRTREAHGQLQRSARAS